MTVIHVATLTSHIKCWITHITYPIKSFSHCCKQVQWYMKVNKKLQPNECKKTTVGCTEILIPTRKHHSSAPSAKQVDWQDHRSKVIHVHVQVFVYFLCPICPWGMQRECKRTNNNNNNRCIEVCILAHVKQSYTVLTGTSLYAYIRRPDGSVLHNGQLSLCHPQSSTSVLSCRYTMCWEHYCDY